jgi:hypothetical protein
MKFLKLFLTGIFFLSLFFSCTPEPIEDKMYLDFKDTQATDDSHGSVDNGSKP